MNSSENSRQIRVLVVDDSGFMRTALTRMIESDPSLKVIGAARDGSEALEKISALKPDIVTLDIEMPRLNGLDALKRIMSDFPLPVIMVSVATQEGADTTFEALSLGAFDYVPKQVATGSLDIVKIRDDLVEKIKAAFVSRRRKPVQRTSSPVEAPPMIVPRPASARGPSIVIIGTSTGGPKALQDILPLLPADLGVGILVVQHMPSGFTGPFANRLNKLCKVSVQEADHRQEIMPGVVYIGPAGLHMTVDRPPTGPARICLSHEPLGTLHTPSVDVTMLSVAERFRSAAMGIILTGMGADGALGMQAIFKAGGLTVGQDEATCTVYGMPRACAVLGILQRVVPLQRIPEQILIATEHYKRRA
jgi:two-component system, chemotaxis family, protein-glutamate methylesterase/glutaminase